MVLGSLQIPATDLDVLRRRIDDRLAEYTRYAAGCPAQLQQAIQYCLLAPGKRLRPIMVVLAHQACGGSLETALAPACAIEMVHTYSLVHDDLPAMDDDELRRGRPTCHIAFDEATAILVGDALLTQAFEILATDVKPADVATRAIQALATAAGACCLIGGQASDLAAENRQLTMEALESVHLRKTAALFSAAAFLGGWTAGGSADQTARLAEFGRLFGLSFQIMDDLLDVHGRTDQMGKRAQKDSGRGKSTYPQLIGDVASYEKSKNLIEQAIAQLASFGPQAQALREFAERLSNRQQ